MKRTIFAAAAATTLSACAAVHPQTSDDLRPPALTSGDSAAEALVEANAEEWLTASDTPAASVAVIRGGRIIWSGVYGERAPGAPADAQTLFNVASLMKPVTAEAVLRLATRGKIDLFESMAAYWLDPDIANDPRAELLTPDTALTHRTGFPNWRAQAEGGVLAFKAEPGASPGYSGEGFEYLARFLENKVGAPFETIVQNEVLTPLGMTNTALTQQPWIEDRIVLSQGPDGSRRPAPVATVASAADDLITTAEDYARFVAAVMQDDSVSDDLAASRRTISAVQLSGACPWGDGDDRSVGCPERLGFGYAWAIFEYAEDTVILQGGGDWGERSLAFFVPERDLGVVVLTSGANGSTFIRQAVGAIYANDDFLRFLDFQARQAAHSSMHYYRHWP